VLDNKTELANLITHQFKSSKDLANHIGNPTARLAFAGGEMWSYCALFSSMLTTLPNT